MTDEPVAPRLDYLRLLRRVATNRWRLVLLIFLGIAVPLAYWSVVLTPKRYEATATMFIEDSRKERPTLVREFVPPSDTSFQLAILRSRSLAEAVVENLSRQATDELLERSMHRDYFLEAQNVIRKLQGHDPIVHSPQQRILAEVQRARVQFVPLPSGEVQIKAAAFQPRVAAELANTYVEVLQTRSRSYIREEARATREFIENLLDQTKIALQQSEEALLKFQQARGVASLPERAGLELSKLAQLENTLADIQISKEIAKVRLDFLKGGKDITGKPLPSGARLAVQQLRDRLGQLEDKLAALLEKYTEQHPLVAATRAEIRDVQASLSGTLQSLQEPKPSIQIKLGAAERNALAKQMADLEAEISALEAREAVLKPRIAALSRHLSGLGTEEMGRLKLFRNVDTQRNLYNILSERLGTARIQEQAEARGLRVIDLAKVPLSPSSSPVNKKLLLGLMLALGLGGGAAVLLEYFNLPIETEDDVMNVAGLPVLGWLPAVEIRRLKNGRSHAPLTLIESPTPRALPAEGCRTIRTSIEALSRRSALRTIMLASAGPREGKSTVLLNLGWVFRELGYRVMLVDSDLRRPALHRAVRAPAKPGLADLLTANVSWDEVQRPIKDDFTLLPAGGIEVANPGSLLSPDKIRKFLDLARDRADLVLFDSAPVLAVSDNLMLASMVDGVILVVRAGRTQPRDLLRAREQLEKVGSVILGVVINQVPPRETRRYYKRYADYYGPDEALPLQRSPWNPRSWWRGRRSAGNGKKGAPR